MSNCVYVEWHGEIRFWNLYQKRGRMHIFVLIIDFVKYGHVWEVEAPCDIVGVVFEIGQRFPYLKCNYHLVVWFQVFLDLDFDERIRIFVIFPLYRHVFYWTRADIIFTFLQNFHSMHLRPQELWQVVLNQNVWNFIFGFCIFQCVDI